MKVSYEGIGAWSATFETADAREGQVVKLSAPRTVSPCAAGDAFCGVAGPVRGGVCGVQLGGLAEVSYTGARCGQHWFDRRRQRRRVCGGKRSGVLGVGGG